MLETECEVRERVRECDAEPINEYKDKHSREPFL
jgi:hypothetical protein